MKTIIKYLALFIAALSLGATLNAANAQAKRAATLRSISTYDAKPVKASRGYMYRTYKLTKRVHHLTNYRNTKFFKIATVKVRTAKGKNAYYNYLTTANGKTQGYVWHGFVHKRAVTKHQPTYEPSTDADTSTDSNIDNNDTTTNLPSNTKAFKLADFSETEYINAFLTALNKERAKRHIAPLTLSNTLNPIAHNRAEQDKAIGNLSHTDKNGNTILKPIMRNLGTYTKWAECLSESTIITDPSFASDGGYDVKSTAEDSVDQYIYNDALSNWGHRDSLLNPAYTEIGIGAVIDNTNPHDYGYDVYDAIITAN